MEPKDKFDELMAWVSEGDRSFEFKYDRSGYISIWLYDYTVMVGMYIKLDDPIPPDFPALVEEKERAELERLVNKYAKNNNGDL